MSDYIELNTYGTPSSSEESIFVKPRSRIHPGYGASRVPLRPTSTGVFAGSGIQKIHESQLGIAASSNPLGINRNRDTYYASVPYELRRLSLEKRRELIKPYQVEWTSDNIKRYNKHWQLLEKKPKPVKPVINRGFVLPFSNNIGPGNTPQEPETIADSIALEHDHAYNTALDKADVYKADREAISKFAQEIITGTNPISQNQAILGAAGLGVKHIAETILNRNIYGQYEKTRSESQGEIKLELSK